MRPSGMWVWVIAMGAALEFGVGRAQPVTQDKLIPTSESGSTGKEPLQPLRTDAVVTPMEPAVELPQFIRERMLLFNRMREEYLARHLALIHQLRDAADAQQAQLRQRVRKEREAWLQHGGRPTPEQAGVRLDGLQTDFARQATEDGGELRQEPVLEPELKQHGTE